MYTSMLKMSVLVGDLQVTLSTSAGHTTMMKTHMTSPPICVSTGTGSAMVTAARVVTGSHTQLKTKKLCLEMKTPVAIATTTKVLNG